MEEGLVLVKRFRREVLFNDIIEFFVVNSRGWEKFRFLYVLVVGIIVFWEEDFVIVIDVEGCVLWMGLLEGVFLEVVELFFIMELEFL